MSSQFSYELDERQIRILMQDAESEYNEALWNKFDELAAVSCKQSINIGSYVPKFNLSISRSIVVPILFIILIGGLSAMLFSFVDFKKKEAIDKEIPLVANPENFKKPEVVAAKVIKPIDVQVKKISKDTIAKPSPTSEAVISPSASLVIETKKPELVKLADTKPKEEVSKIVEIKKNTTPLSSEKKKKKRKIKSEELPTIKAVTNLNEGVNEPELDLDLK